MILPTSTRTWSLGWTWTPGWFGGAQWCRQVNLAEANLWRSDPYRGHGEETQPPEAGQVPPAPPRAAGDGSVPPGLHDEEVPRVQGKGRDAKGDREIWNHRKSPDSSYKAVV